VRSAAFLVALFVIVVGTVGLVSPDSLTTVRRLYFATPVDYMRPALFAWAWDSWAVAKEVGRTGLRWPGEDSVYEAPKVDARGL